MSNYNCVFVNDIALKKKHSFGESAWGISSVPASVDVKPRVLCYWYKLVNISDNSRICKVMYDLVHNMYVDGSFKHHWIDFIKTTLGNPGLSFIFTQQAWIQNSLNLLSTYVLTALQSTMECWNIHKGKLLFNFEIYLINLRKHKWKTQIELRTGNGYFPINHYDIPSENIANIKYPICTQRNADFFHYLLRCSYFNRLRGKIWSKISYWYIVFLPKHHEQWNTLFNVTISVKETLMSLKEFIDITRP